MNRNDRHPYRPQTRRAAVAAFAAALVATVLSTGSVFALLHSIDAPVAAVQLASAA